MARQAAAHERGTPVDSVAGADSGVHLERPPSKSFTSPVHSTRMGVVGKGAAYFFFFSARYVFEGLEIVGALTMA